MRRWMWLVGLAGAGAVLWFAFAKKRLQPKPQPLNFLFTCDVRGRLVPCGCFTGQLGGLTRIATLFGPKFADDIRVDVGDALAGNADYERMQYGYIQQGFARMGYDALNVGHREARFSAAQLRELKTRAPVPMLSANLLDRATGAPIFDGYKIIRRGPWRIALVGVLDGHGIGDALGDGLAVETMEVALGKLLPQLKGRADAIVLLAFADEAALKELARQFYEIDVILGGNVRQPSQQLVKENRSLILATTNESRAVGVLQTRLLAPSRMEAVKGEVSLVNDRIPQDAEIAALAAAYRDEIRQTKLALDDPVTLQEDMVPGVQARASYAGTQNCASCHQTAARVWAQSGHARAFATLLAQKADADPNCLPCHTIGFGTPSGYRREFGAQKFVDVGCESCHGSGSEHVAQRRAGGEVTTHFRPIGAGDCLKCHHGEFSRPFAWDQFWPHIMHRKEPASRKIPAVVPVSAPFFPATNQRLRAE